jgi:hypothetical protein
MTTVSARSSENFGGLQRAEAAVGAGEQVFAEVAVEPPIISTWHSGSPKRQFVLDQLGALVGQHQAA